MAGWGFSTILQYGEILAFFFIHQILKEETQTWTTDHKGCRSSHSWSSWHRLMRFLSGRQWIFPSRAFVIIRVVIGAEASSVILNLPSDYTWEQQILCNKHLLCKASAFKNIIKAYLENFLQGCRFNIFTLNHITADRFPKHAVVFLVIECFKASMQLLVFILSQNQQRV